MRWSSRIWIGCTLILPTYWTWCQWCALTYPRSESRHANTDPVLESSLYFIFNIRIKTSPRGTNSMLKPTSLKTIDESLPLANSWKLRLTFSDSDYPPILRRARRCTDVLFGGRGRREGRGSRRTDARSGGWHTAQRRRSHSDSDSDIIGVGTMRQDNLECLEWWWVDTPLYREERRWHNIAYY